MTIAVYIIGPMTGWPDRNCQAFMEAEELIRRAARRGDIESDVVVLNPARLPAGLPEEKYMPICMAMLEAADAFYCLPDWDASDGACAEYYFARKQGKREL